MLDNFEFQLKTKIFFGKNQEKNIGKILKSFGFERVFIIIGKNSVRSSGLLEIVEKSLQNLNILYLINEGVRANPTSSLGNSFIKNAKVFKPDCILAIGGGSVIDTAKYVSVGYYYQGDAFDFNLHKAIPEKSLPIGVILTLSASGSESSNSCVMQDDSINKKCGFNSELVRPVFAIENPELTYSVSKEQTINGIVDIMMHTLERYFHESRLNEPADYFAEAVLKNVIFAGEIAVKDPNNYQARSDLMIMGSMSHNGLTSIGKSALLDIHQLEHGLSGVYPEIAHGAGLSVLLPAWMKVYVKANEEIFARLARNVFGYQNKNLSKCAEQAIIEIENYFKKIGAPLNFNDLGITNPNIDLLVDIVSNKGERVINHPVLPMDKDVMKKVFELCK